MGAQYLTYNTHTLGICVQGDYMKENMPSEQKKAVLDLCIYLCDKYSIEIIKGHGELNQTDCPCINFPLQEIREAVENVKNK